MSSTDDWLQNGLPVFHGGKDKATARQMLSRVGGSSGFKTDYRTNTDGSVTVLQCKGLAPPQVTTIHVDPGGFLFRYSFAIDASYAEQFTKNSPVFSRASLSKYLAHDNFVDVWWQPGRQGGFSRATSVPVAMGRVPLWHPDGSGVYSDFPAHPVGSIVYVGNKYHGLISKEGGVLSVGQPLSEASVVSSSAKGPEIDDPDTILVVLNPSEVNVPVSGGVLTNQAILSTHKRVYDYDTGILWGGNVSVYDAADGSRFSVRAESTSVSARGNAPATVIVSIFAKRTAPILAGGSVPEETLIAEHECYSPGTNPSSDSAWCFAFFRPSPSGKKLCVTVVRAKSVSEDFRNAFYITSVYEVTLYGGSSTEVPATSIALIDSSDDDVAVTEYGAFETRLPKELSHVGDVDEIVGEYVIGAEGYRVFRRTTTWSNEQWPVFTVNPISAAERSQIALAGYTTASGDIDTLNVVRVKAKAEYSYVGYASDARTISRSAEWTVVYFINGWGEFYSPHATIDVKQYDEFSYEFRYLGPRTDYAYDVTGTITISVVVNERTTFSETRTGKMLAGNFAYTATPVFGNYGGWVDPQKTAVVDTPPSHEGSYTEVFPQVTGGPWANLVIGYASNNTVMWTTGFPPLNSSSALITLNGDLMHIFVPKDEADLYWASYNPVTKQVDTQPYRTWI